MASLGQIIKEDRHPLWLVDSIILSAVAYADDPEEEMKVLSEKIGLPPSAQYDFVPDEDLTESGFASCKQSMVLVKSQTGGHLIVACRGTYDLYDALTDLNFIHRTMSLAPGAAHAGFLDRAKTIPLDYFRRLLIRGERIVFTGHSLGGAVCSLLALRLLEATGKWCHEQVQCYTFGCPFFADYELARYINKTYKHHFVHIVSRNDIVPKLMPVAYTLYSCWYGLQVGPWGDIMSISRVAFLCVQVMNPRLRIKADKIPLLAIGSQALRFVPGILQFLIHRALALVLSHQSGYGYSFAGRMVLLDGDSSKMEYSDVNKWSVEESLNFHFGISGLDAVKEHFLLSYIETIFNAKSAEMTKGMQAASKKTSKDIPDARVEVHHSTVNVQPRDKEPRPTKLARKKTMKELEVNMKRTSTIDKKPRKVKGAMLKSRVSCLIFARRMQEASPAYVKKAHSKRSTAKRLFMITLGKVGDFTRRFNAFFVMCSVLGGAFQLRKLLKHK